MGDPLHSILDEHGPLARVLAGYELRPAQSRMMDLVDAAFRDDGVLAVEAGTGTGKTFAYLVPALRWAAQTGEKVVIATHTIALQEQILNKDLPMVAAALGIEVKASLVKGRGNYLCRRKVAEALDHEARQVGPAGGGRPPEEYEALVRIGQWVRDNDEGSRAELGFVPPPEVWDDLRSDRDSCLRTKCGYHQRCYYYQARRAGQKAEVLIANHHLVMADLALKAAISQRDEKEKAEGVLPPYTRIFFDEAHHLEDVAGSYFGVEVSRTGVLRLLSRLAGGDRRNSGAGFLPVLQKNLEARIGHVDGQLRAGYLDAIDRIDRRLIPFARWLADVAVIAFAEVSAWAQRQPAEPGGRGDTDRKVRLTDEADEQFRIQVIPALDRLVNPPDGLLGLADELVELRKVILCGNQEAEPELAGALVDLSGRISAVLNAAAAIDDVAKGEGPGVGTMTADRVRWIETDPTGARTVRLMAAPVDLGPALSKHLFDAHATVVLTSATLSAAGDFSYLGRRIGLDRVVDGRVVSETLPSPFDWPRQALVAVPTDIPAPDEAGYEEALVEKVFEAVTATGGGAFVLFTSHRLLRQVHAALAPRLAAAELVTLVHGEEDRSVLLEKFRREKDAVLFATDSFWEGVDVPGEALRNVILTRLPFRVPSEPLLVARAERITAAGGDPFAELSVPQALLKFRQGLGRLIRTRTDRGILVVLDKRIVSRRYGRRFIAALPPCRLEEGYSADVFAAAREFLR